MQIVSCLELMTNLFIFIHNGGIQKLLYSPHLKMVLIFFVTKVLQKGTIYSEWVYVSVSDMRFCLTQWSATRFYSNLSVYSRPLPSEKIAPWQPSWKSPFGYSCSFLFFLYLPKHLELILEHMLFGWSFSWRTSA